jgi:hypothetical protein
MLKLDMLREHPFRLVIFIIPHKDSVIRQHISLQARRVSLELRSDRASDKEQPWDGCRKPQHASFLSIFDFVKRILVPRSFSDANSCR